MSLFVRAQRGDAAPQFLRCGSICSTIGEDHRGVLTSHAPAKPIFSIYALDTRYFFFPHAPCAIQEELLPANTAHPITGGQLIAHDDYLFSFMPTLPEAALIAENIATTLDLTPDDTITSSMPKLEFSLAQLSTSIPLVQNCWCTIGRSDTAILQIPLDDIQKIHCTVCNHGSSVEISPRSGEIELNGARITTPQHVSNNSVVTLLPGSIPIKLRFPI